MANESRGRSTFAIAAVLGAFAFVACDEGPAQVYYGMTTSAEMGDRKGFLEGFTKESQPLIEAQISLSEAYGLKRDDPIKQLVFKRVDKVTTEDGKAILDVSRGSTRQKILMVETDEGWRIDTKKLADFWEDQRKRR